MFLFPATLFVGIFAEVKYYDFNIENANVQSNKPITRRVAICGEKFKLSMTLASKLSFSMKKLKQSTNTFKSVTVSLQNVQGDAPKQLGDTFDINDQTPHDLGDNILMQKNSDGNLYLHNDVAYFKIAVDCP